MTSTPDRPSTTPSRPGPLPDQRHGPLAGRALANRAAVLGCVLLGHASLLACGPRQDQPAPPPAAGPDARARVLALVEILTPLQTTETSDVNDRRFLRGEELLAELRRGGREVGVEALAALREAPSGAPRPLAVERGLLDVAAHAAPEESRPLLEALVTEYGTSLDLRTEATRLLAETAPERAIALLEPWVVKARPARTMPPPEFLVRAWVEACTRTGRSPVRELADVATNILMDETARIVAVKELGKHREPLASQALQAILVESTGDGYLRRMAAQGLRDSLPRETACAIFLKVAEREADVNFALFLSDLLQKNCE